MHHLFLIRGLPSSGKSTLAQKLCIQVFEADQFFYNNEGKYKFNPSLLQDAHKWCQNMAEKFLVSGRSCIVANTFTQRWEMQPYIEMSESIGIQYTVIDLFDGGCDDQTLCNRNKHGVPIEAFSVMRNRYEHDWKNGNKLPPWLRDCVTVRGVPSREN